MRRLMLLAALLLGLALVTGCGSSGDDSSSGGGDETSGAEGGLTLDVGLDEPLSFDTNKPKVAFFDQGTSNVYALSYAKGVAEAAEKRGLDVTRFDPQLDATTQLTQVQNALQQGGFDAYLIVTLDGNTMCPVLTQQAPQANVAVVTGLTPICDRGLKPEGDEQWSPGTLAHVQNDSTYTEDEAWVDAICKRLEDDGKTHTVAVLNGPSIITVAKAIKKSTFEHGAETCPHMDFKYEVETDFSTPTSLAKTQTLLQAHPDVDTILSMYTDITVGALRAIKAAGRDGEIRVFDIGGGKQSVEAIENGELEMSTAHTPYDNGVAGIDAIADAFEGKEIPRYIGVYPEGATMGNPLVLDKNNAGEWEPQF